MFEIIWHIMGILCKGVAFVIFVNITLYGINQMRKSHKEYKKKKKEIKKSIPYNAPITSTAIAYQNLSDSINAYQKVQTQNIAESIVQWNSSETIRLQQQLNELKIQNAMLWTNQKICDGVYNSDENMEN